MCEFASKSESFGRRSHCPGLSARAASVILAALLALLAPETRDASAQSQTPGQSQNQPQGPIVGGQRLQPKRDQLPDPDVSDEDAKRLKELSREVLEASDPANIPRRRQHQ